MTAPCRPLAPRFSPPRSNAALSINAPIFDALDKRLGEAVVTAYVGYDCTADSLHVGSLLAIMLLRLWQQSGHKPIVLMGGGTTRIGDPSFRDTARPLLDDAEIARNMAGIRKVFAKFIDFGDGPADAVMVNNADWLDELRYIPLLREVGRHFSVNRMLTQDSVRLRLDREQPLSFLEFNYPILQAYDFVELARRFGCEVQIGGSDQWGNIVGGVELGRRMDGRSLYGLTTPLLTTASGDKMGKTAQGAVWLNAERLQALRILAILAQHRGRRCRPLFAPLYRVAARRDRSARATATSTKRKRSWRPRRPHSAMAARRQKQRRKRRARCSRRGARGDDLPRTELPRDLSSAGCQCSNCSAAPGSPHRTAKRGG